MGSLHLDASLAKTPSVVSVVSAHAPSPEEVQAEAGRLFGPLSKLGWSMNECLLYAPLTLQINRLKKETDAVVLAHSYQTPDIMYGIADFVGDSYELSKKAMESPASTIVFCGVRFMAETAKIMNPQKTVLLPAPDAGCSLSESITADDVRLLKRENPGCPVVVYVNTSAEVKAESDVCCTSANALKIIQALPDNKIVFIPDEFMTKNLQKLTDKQLVGWGGRCIVHERFGKDQVLAVREQFPGVKILAHTECPPDVIGQVDLAGGTGDMIRYMKSSDAKTFMLVTECGLGDRMRAELPEKRVVGTCNLCPYMKKNNLLNVLQVLQSARPEQVVDIPEPVRIKAHAALQRMFELSK
ncbi:quinolinate synthase NadA [Candidatus Micrarchaeota archaeon]|nr:quinolinate synthase NadA [Candidatus Micrarchaeota archaeon]